MGTTATLREEPVMTEGYARPAQRIVSSDAVQGIAVDVQHVYTIANRSISMYDKFSGEPVSRWQAQERDGRIVHLDSGVIHEGKLYAAHSNWPGVPMMSSVEIFDIDPLVNVAHHSFGTLRGSFTWLDRHDGFWWGTFTDYGTRQSVSRLTSAALEREISGTRVVKMDDAFNIAGSWQLPASLLARMAPKNNSGGSWGPDGRLYLTGHDRAEIYVVMLPAHGEVANWVATFKAPAIEGQGLAWDRFALDPILYGINRSHRQAVRMSVNIPESVNEAQHRREPSSANR